MKPKLKALWSRSRQTEGFTSFYVLESESANPTAHIYSGEVDKVPVGISFQEVPITEDVSKKIEEFYKGPDDSRLPDDVKAMPVGRREDFIEEFNWNFWYYNKDSDPEYDENKRADENSVNYALRKAYKYAQREYPSTTPAEEDNSSEPESGISESSLRHKIESITTTSGNKATRIRESVAGVVIPGSYKESSTGGEADVDVIIIQKGWSLNGRHYGDQALEQISAQINESKPGFMNHGPTFERDPRDWAITLHSSSVSEGLVKAKMQIFHHPNGDFLRERIDKAPQMFGGSIDAFVVIEEGKEDGIEGPVVTEVPLLNSWDIVMFPAAGGAIVAPASESQKNTRSRKNQGEQNTMDLETLKDKHPALYELIVQQAKSEAEAVAKDIEEKLKASEEKARDLQAELDALKTAEEKRKAKEAFNKELSTLLSETFAEDEISDEFKGLLIEEGPENMERIKKMVTERRRLLDDRPKGTHENSDAGSDGDANKPSTDEDELARFRAKKAS
jgi:hypothetical protein